MFNNLKSKEFFDPQQIHAPVHVAGLGAVGGSVAEILCRLGLDEINIWDMDNVAAHNLGNQIYRTCDINQPKETALTNILTEINPEIKLTTHGKLETTSKISGYIFLCVDNIDLRRDLCTTWKKNPNVLYVTDGRMRLTDGMIYAADWMNLKEQNNLINSMNFSHEEALAATPVSACGLTLSVVCTPRTLASLMVSNFIKFVNTGKYNRFIQVDAYQPFIDPYRAN